MSNFLAIGSYNQQRVLPLGGVRGVSVGE